MRKGAISLLMTLVLCFVFSCKKKQENVPSLSDSDSDFEKHYSIVSKYENQTSLLTIDIALDDMLHAYAFGEKIGRPVALEISPKNGWATSGPVEIPKGTIKKLSELGESVVLQGKFQIAQKLIKGSGKGEAILHLQLCTDSICDRPRVHIIPIE